MLNKVNNKIILQKQKQSFCYDKTTKIWPTRKKEETRAWDKGILNKTRVE